MVNLVWSCRPWPNCPFCHSVHPDVLTVSKLCWSQRLLEVLQIPQTGLYEVSSSGLSAVHGTFRKKETQEQNDILHCKPCWAVGSALCITTEMLCLAQQPMGQTLPVICSGTRCDTSQMSQFCWFCLNFCLLEDAWGLGVVSFVLIWFATFSVARHSRTAPGQVKAAQDRAVAVLSSSDMAVWWANWDSRPN